MSELLPSNEVHTDQDFEMALANIAQENYRPAAEYLLRNPDRHQELYNRLVAAYGENHQTPDHFAKLMQEEMEKLRKE